MKKLVTVVIPCYNDGIYIQRAVESILNQTFKDFKIIIVDDGSEQKTKNILKQLNDENITVIFQENQGVSCARNNAIQSTNSEYILTLDADDFFEPTFIEKAIEQLNLNNTLGVVGCFANVIKDKKLIKIIKPIGGNLANFLIKNEGSGNALYRRECWEQVGGYDEKMKLGYEDWEFWIAILSKDWEMKIIKEALFNYRIKSVSRDQIAVDQYDLILKKYIFNKHKNVFKKHSELVIVSLLEKNEQLRKNSYQYKDSLEYMLGKGVLGPFKYIRRMLNKFK